MVCIGIIWNTSFPFKDEILKDISNFDSAEIIEEFDLDLNDDYESFVRGMYELDSIAQWKVDKKVNTMFESSDLRKVGIVFLNVDSSKQEYHPLKKRMVYSNLENLKSSIRNKYKEKVNLYFFDNAFHMTDDEKEFKTTYSYLVDFIKSRENKEEKGYTRIRKELKKYE